MYYTHIKLEFQENASFRLFFLSIFVLPAYYNIIVKNVIRKQ